MAAKMPDALNAEIALGSITSVEDALDWLGHTYFQTRLLKEPSLYGVSAAAVEKDPKLKGPRSDLIHTAALLLDKAGLVKYDKENGKLEVGFYIWWESVYD